jgi:hypothetical protein
MGPRKRFGAIAAAAASAVVVGFGLASAQQYSDPVTLPREVVAAAAAFQGYMERAAGMSPTFKGPDSIYQGLKAGAAYEPAQFQEGMIGYGAIAALQDDRFIQGVERAASGPAERQALVARLLADPGSVMALDGSQGALRRVRTALQRRAQAVLATGGAVRQSAYDVQHAAWSRARIPNSQSRLAEVKALSIARASFADGAEARLVKTLADPNRMGDDGGSPTPVLARSLALAAVAVLGEASSRDMSRLQPLLFDQASRDCLKMSKFVLYQCVAVAGPHYEDVFCLGQHALTDTGQCVARAASSTPMSPYSPALTAPTRQEVASAPLGSAPLPRALRAD